MKKSKLNSDKVNPDDKVRKCKRRITSHIVTFLICIYFSISSFAIINISTSAADYPAGTIIPADPNVNPIILPTALTLNPYSYVFLATGNLTNQQWSIALGGSLSATSEMVINFLPDAATASSASIGTAAAGGPSVAAVGTYTFVLLVQNSNGESDEQQFRITVRQPVDIVLVLDKSGSMAWNSGTTTTSRWNALRAAVSLFMDGLEKFDVGGTNGDKIGLTFFDGAAVPPPTGFPTPLISTNGSTTPVNNNLTGGSAVTPGGSTAFGAGLQTGLGNMPVAANRRRIIITYTDGEQNVPNTTHVNVPGDNKVHLGAGVLTNDQLKIYPIGIGASGALPAILNQIAQSVEGGGFPQISTEDGTSMSGNYGTQFINVLADVLRTGSPQIVDTRLGRFIPSGISVTGAPGPFQTEQSFTVNKGIDKLVFNVISNVQEGLAITSVKKDGTEFIQLGSMSSGIGFRSFELDFLKQGMSTVKPQGTWTIKAQAFGSDQYEMILIVDDHKFKYELSTGNTRLKVGSPIPLTAKLKTSSLAVKDATVQAIILKPGDDLGDLLATTNAKIDTTAGPDPSNPGVQKYQDLLKDSSFLKKLLAKEQIINLSFNAGDSTYTGQFANPDVSGVYHVIFRIKSTGDTTLGTVERYQKSSVYVYFPDVDLAQSNVVLTTNASGQTILSFRPKASNGKFIGPGWASMIKLDSSAAQIQQIVDHGDGSYSITLTGDVNSNGVFSIGGETVYSGKISNIGKAGDEFWKQWWFWALLILILIILFFIFRKKKP